jgi:glycosyltransferase involved in cell wall biosynthesis
MKSKTLSVVLATYNEEKNIVSCIKSFKGIADEIIIVDESSTDKTRELAKKLGAKVYKVKHHPIFHITKNKAIKKATKDWVLQMDADERLTQGMQKEIESLLSGKYFGVDSWISPIKSSLPFFKKPKKLTQPAAAYWLPRKNLFLDRYLKNTGQYPDPVIRLFQRGMAILPAKSVHEQMKVKGIVGWLHEDLDHLSTPKFERYLERENRYSDLEAKNLFDKKVKISLANTLSYLFIKPLKTFLSLYIRHRGFLDGFPGFVFSMYSGFHHAFSYMKLWEIYKNKHAKN